MLMMGMILLVLSASDWFTVMIMIRQTCTYMAFFWGAHWWIFFFFFTWIVYTEAYVTRHWLHASLSLPLQNTTVRSTTLCNCRICLNRAYHAVTATGPVDS